jgi:hypothetical protein
MFVRADLPDHPCNEITPNDPSARALIAWAAACEAAAVV